MADEQNGNVAVDSDYADQDVDDGGEEPAFDEPRYEVIASGDTFLRYDTFTGFAWILQNPGSPTVARWVPVPEPEEDFEDADA